MGEKFLVEKVLEWGMVNWVCDDDKLMDEVMMFVIELVDGLIVVLLFICKFYVVSFDNLFED